MIAHDEKTVSAYITPRVIRSLLPPKVVKIGEKRRVKSNTVAVLSSVLLYGLTKVLSKVLI